jgi:hypothetical protein
MTITPRRLLVLAFATLTATGCDGMHASPDGRDLPHVAAAIEETPPTIADAAIATYWGGQARQVTLTTGAFTGPGGERVELLRQHYAVGDLEGDGAGDAVVALSVTNAGAENGQYIAVLRHLGLDTISLGTALLGSDVEVLGLHVDGRRIVVDLVRPSATGPAEPARATYELRRGGLVAVPDRR